jgi:hypothetical protein
MLSRKCRHKEKPAAPGNGGGGIGCAALRLSPVRCADLRLELRSHPTERFHAGCAGKRRGWDWLRCAPPVSGPLRGPAARTAFSSHGKVSCRLRRETEGVGFEPTETRASSVFKTDAIDHSATPPDKRKISTRDKLVHPGNPRRKARSGFQIEGAVSEAFLELFFGHRRFAVSLLEISTV